MPVLFRINPPEVEKKGKGIGEKQKSLPIDLNS